MVVARSIGCLAWAVAAIAISATPAAAQDPDSLYGRRVTAVAFEVDGRVDTSPTLAQLSDLRIGAPLGRRDVRATIAHLDNIGRFDDIRVIGTPVDSGVEIVFRLVPRRAISEVVIRGGPGAWESALRAHLRQRFSGLPTGVRTSTIETTARQFLRDEGYPDATVRAVTEARPGEVGATLVLDVATGAIARVASVDVRGRSPMPANVVIDRTRTAVGQSFQRRAVEAALASLEDELRGDGYYEVRTTLEVVDVAGGVAVTIEVNAGPRVEVRIVPAQALPGRLADLVPVRRLGSADEDLLEDSRARIERALRAQGYWRASAPFTRVLEDDGARLVITFAITRGARYTVDRVEVPNTLSQPADAVRQIIGVGPGEVFDDDRFRAGVLAAVEAYQRAGFHQVRADPTYQEGAASADGQARVVLSPNITEGPRAVIGDVTFEFVTPSAVPEVDLRAVMRSVSGEPYVGLNVAIDEDALRFVYQARGYRNAQVTLTPTFGDEGRAVALAARVSPRERILVGQISVVGQLNVSERAILDEMALAVGEPAGVTAINEAQARLIDMGVFRRVSVSSIDQFTESNTHLIVNVVEADATSIRFSGGIEGGRYDRPVAGGGRDDLIEIAPRGGIDVTRRNVGGRNRSLGLSSRLTLRRSRSVEGAGGFGFPEYRVSATFRERRAFRSNTDLLVGLTSEQAVRTGFNFIRQGANAEVLRSFGRRVSVSGRYLLDFTKLFDEQYAEANSRSSTARSRRYDSRAWRLASRSIAVTIRRRRRAGRSSLETSSWLLGPSVPKWASSRRSSRRQRFVDWTRLPAPCSPARCNWVLPAGFRASRSCPTRSTLSPSSRRPWRTFQRASASLPVAAPACAAIAPTGWPCRSCSRTDCLSAEMR
jgi:outer membrane protein assembly factor BamA